MAEDEDEEDEDEEDEDEDEDGCQVDTEDPPSLTQMHTKVDMRLTNMSQSSFFNFISFLVLWYYIFGCMVFIYSVFRFWSNDPVSK